MPRAEAVTAVTIVDDEDDEAQRADALKTLRRIAAEAIIWQDAAEELLEEIRERRPLADLAPRGGKLVSRFVALREQLPTCADAEIRRHTRILRMVFDHHAMTLSSSLDLLAVDWRSERMIEQLERIDGLGAPAQWLETVRGELEHPVR
jgi:hypothetical protein